MFEISIILEDSKNIDMIEKVISNVKYIIGQTKKRYILKLLLGWYKVVQTIFEF